MNAKTVKDIVGSIKFCNIATVCEDGPPWNTPVFFVYDGELNFYWWSNQKAVHSQNILRDPRVFITVYDSTMPENKAKAAYFQAKAGLLDESEIRRITKLYNKRAKFFQLDENVTGGGCANKIVRGKAGKDLVERRRQRERILC